MAGGLFLCTCLFASGCVNEAFRLRYHKGENFLEGVVQTYLLTINTTLGRQRFAAMNKSMNSLHLREWVPVVGVSKLDYANEMQQMLNTRMPMTAKERYEWGLQDCGGSISTVPPKEQNASGSLACALGHRYIWQLAREAFRSRKMRKRQRESVDERWAIILEDDARPSADAANLLKAALSNVPQDVDMVFLEDRHCKSHTGVVSQLDRWAVGATAYAITAKAADALLLENFSHCADHWLNFPINDGSIKAYCPSSHVFQGDYEHSSEINAATSFLDGVSCYERKD